MQEPRDLAVGGIRPLDGSGDTRAYQLPRDDLLTHGVVLGMTGSGKTGLLTVLVEEVLRSRVPVILIDVKGDLPNLLLTFPNLSAHEFAPWMDEGLIERSGQSRHELAGVEAQRWQERLAEWNLGTEQVRELAAAIAPRVFTPGLLSGEPLHVLSSLEQPSPLWRGGVDADLETARESLSASISLLLRLIGRDPDPTRSRDHVVLSVFAERRLKLGMPADAASLLADVREPPLERMGALAIDEYLPKKDRQSLANALNTLLASPTFESWRTGAPLNVRDWLAPRPDGSTPAVVISVAHLDDDERELVLGIILDQLLAWLRTLPGTHHLRALLAFDEVYGFIPPHPANPPTKRPLVTLIKQARAFGLGVLIATQNPMDLDYRALSNAGVWCIGRLATDADRERVVDALSGCTPNLDAETLDNSLKLLAPRWFVLRNIHQNPPLTLLQSRTTLCWLKGPMTREDLKRAGRR